MATRLYSVVQEARNLLKKIAGGRTGIKDVILIVRSRVIGIGRELIRPYLATARGVCPKKIDKTEQGEKCMARKASAQDAQAGRTLWLKDHGGWRAIVVQTVGTSPKGLKIKFRDLDGRDGQCLLTACYRPTHS